MNIEDHLGDGLERSFSECKHCRKSIYCYPSNLKPIYYHSKGLNIYCGDDLKTPYAEPFSKEDRIKAILTKIDDL